MKIDCLDIAYMGIGFLAFVIGAVMLRNLW
jgi:hypothetical protein